MNLSLIKVEYNKAEHVSDLISLLQMYAKDPMGGNEAISDEVIAALPSALQARPFMNSFIVYDEGEPVAFSNCIESFSTFSGKGVMNIHDFAVSPASRGKDVSQFLLKGIQDYATLIGCTKLTLEVLEGNKSAIRAYEKAGFAAYELSPDMGKAMFWQKYID